MKIIIEGCPEEVAIFVMELSEEISAKASAQTYDYVIDILKTQQSTTSFETVD